MDQFEMLIKMVLSIERAFLYRSILARRVIVCFNVCIVRINVAAENTPGLGTIGFLTTGPFWTTDPALKRKMKRILVA